MTLPDVRARIISHLDRLTSQQQQQVLDFAASLVRPTGTPSEVLRRFAGSIPSDQLDQMEKAIEDCERIDSDEW
jgi:hypothetical protein